MKKLHLLLLSCFLCLIMNNCGSNDPGGPQIGKILSDVEDPIMDAQLACNYPSSYFCIEYGSTTLDSKYYNWIEKDCVPSYLPADSINFTADGGCSRENVIGYCDMWNLASTYDDTYGGISFSRVYYYEGNANTLEYMANTCVSETFQGDWVQIKK